jgi:hypothetical protein
MFMIQSFNTERLWGWDAGTSMAQKAKRNSSSFFADQSGPERSGPKREVSPKTAPNPKGSFFSEESPLPKP